MRFILPGSTKLSKSIPTALDFTKTEDVSQGILAEFAYIATGPQSPLVQEVYGSGNESPCDPRDIVSNLTELSPYYRYLYNI